MTLKTILTTAAITLTTAATLPAVAHADDPRDGLRHCGITPSGVAQVRANKQTSCPFAMNVMRSVRRYQQAHDISYGERFTVRATSPATHKRYTLRCQSARIAIVKIDCYGGTGAHVQIVAAG